MSAFLISWTFLLFLLALVFVLGGSGMAVLLTLLAALPYFAVLAFR
jgi:hypothetical protein